MHFIKAWATEYKGIVNNPKGYKKLVEKGDLACFFFSKRATLATL